MNSAVTVPEVHSWNMAKAVILSGFQVMNAIPPMDVIKIMNENRISFVLAGAYGLAGWAKEPRATEDVDVVVAARHQKKAVRVLLAKFPNLEADDQGAVIRLRERDSQAVAIDVMKTNQPLFAAIFKNARTVEEQKQKYRIPTLEMALAMKFAPMISIMREDYKKYRDASDFMRIIRVNPEIDLDKLAELGDLVYPGGGMEIVEKVRQVRAGEKLVL
jgi:hypothetical protein